MDAYVSSGADGSAFTLYMDDEFIIPGEDGTPGGFINVPNTGDWDTYTTVKTTLNELTEGTHVLKVEITGDWVDLDYLDFMLVGDETEVKLTNAEEVVEDECAIYDLIGRNLGTVEVNNGQIEGFPKGCYLVRNKYGYTQKFLITQ